MMIARGCNSRISIKKSLSFALLKPPIPRLVSFIQLQIFNICIHNIIVSIIDIIIHVQYAKIYLMILL